jgi:hypothetical protein
VVGTRRVFVGSSIVLSAPAIYFLADLRPAPTREQYGTMVLTSTMREVWLRQFRDRIGEIRAVITRDPGGRAVAIWRAAYPRRRTVTLRYGHDQVAYALLATSPAAASARR